MRLNWTEVKIETTAEAVDAISFFLSEIGIEGVEIEDHIPVTEQEQKEMFIDFLPEEEEQKGEAIITFYIPEETELESFLQKIKEGLQKIATYVKIGTGRIMTKQLPGEDWLHQWKAFFKPFYVTEQMIIKPVWEKLEETKEEDIIIEIDPGLAFGTGSHETTKLCIEALQNDCKKGMRILDIGCGSGILSIVCLKLGASFAQGIDIDAHAITATKENAAYNQLSSSQLQVEQGDILQDDIWLEQIRENGYDLLVANLLAELIVPLIQRVKDVVKPGTLFITSGILSEKKDWIVQTFLQAQFEIIETKELGEWASVIARKKDASVLC